MLIVISVGAFAQHPPCTPPVVTITGTDWKCKGVADTLSVSGPGGTTYIWDNGRTTTIIHTGPIEADSTFSVIATNAGCSDTTYFTVDVRIAPAITFSVDTICSGSCITLYPSITSNPPATSFIWNTGATTDTTTVCPDSGTIYLFTASNGCPARKSDTIYVKVCEGINNITASSDFGNVYPNPSYTEFTVDLPTKARISVCDITGRILFSQMENAGTITFGKELNPGMYFLFIDGKPGVKLVKL